MTVLALKKPVPQSFYRFHPDAPHPSVERDELGYYTISHRRRKRQIVNVGDWVNITDQQDYYVIDASRFRELYDVLTTS